MTREDALAAFDELDKLIGGFGYPDEAEHSRLKHVLFRLRHGGYDDSYFLEKLSKIENWADIGFSTRKFNRYSGGAADVRSFAYGDCHIARSLAREHWPAG